jgi:coenzyme F420-0:L-glutamate ligase/coenzyme F420-1:gamma-L-glutamate ligase|tara:strand:- start:2480 stop:3259 length:780 start_codon:yes stop_codon:yes gene_type:complete
MKLTFIGVEGIPMVEPGDDLVALIDEALAASGEQLLADDVIVIAQKIISKAEDRYLDLRSVTPTEEAIRLGEEVDKDPRKVQAILDESNEIVRQRPGVLIVEQRSGFVQANAGIDQSNIRLGDGDPDDLCLLLPIDSDASAQRLHTTIRERHNLEVGIIINDSLGRAWRMGTLGLAIGVAGFTALEDYIGGHDIFGRELLVTQVAAADEMAAGASLVMGQTTEKTPVVIVRGYKPREPQEAHRKGVQPLIRPKEMDMFR